MSEEKQHWREKYLNALDAQDAMEKQHQEQVELLRRALVRVSLAADGQDDGLDQLLGQLREKLRAGRNPAGMDGLVHQLEQAAASIDERKQQASLDIRSALGDMVKPLQDFKLPRPLKKEMDDYQAQLPERSKKIRLYPALLEQLAQLQQQALRELAQQGQAQTRPGLLQKFLGKPDATERVLNNVPDSAIDPQGITATDQNEMTATIRTQDIRTQEEKRSDLERPWEAELSEVIDGFLRGLENQDDLQHAIAPIRAQLNRPLSAHQLIAMLGQVRQLVIDAYLAANQAFAAYLNRVNGELADINDVISGAVAHSASGREASRQLQADMMREMNQLEEGAQNAASLDQLKHQVQSQLGSLRLALNKYQQTDAVQQQLAQQLEALGARIKTMEVEAEESRTTLEKQRHKALHDPLTELPNREAYNERVRAEMQRWQRYGRPLSIAVFDIDRFKKINDNHGHQAGDRVIKVIGRSIAKRLREVDFFCRYGGEEFVALFPETDADTALNVLEKIRDAIARASFNYKEQPLAITISIGLTEFKSKDTIESAFERADHALYAAKSAGRNHCNRV